MPLLILGVVASVEATTVLQHSFKNSFEANAEDYLYSTSSVRKYSEPASLPVTYWGTTANDVDAEIIYRFNPGTTITAGTLFARVNPFDFGSSWGEASIWGSKDGTNWEVLVPWTARGPTSQTLSFGSPLSPGILPNSLLGGTEIYIKGVLKTFNSPNTSHSMSQWARTPTFGLEDYEEDVFSITLESIPEPTTCGLALAAVLCLAAGRVGAAPTF